jgi:hypothetical protein
MACCISRLHCKLNIAYTLYFAYFIYISYHAEEVREFETDMWRAFDWNKITFATIPLHQVQIMMHMYMNMNMKFAAHGSFVLNLVFNFLF